MAQKKKNSRKEWVMYSYIAFFVIASLYVGSLFYNSYIYDEKIYPGIKVAGIEVGNKSREEAKDIISKSISKTKKDIVFVGEGKYVFSESELGLNYDLEETVENAYQVGRKDLKIHKQYDENLSIVVKIDEKKIDSKLFEIINKENSPVDDAVLYMQRGKIATSKEGRGRRVLRFENIEKLKESVGYLHFEVPLQARTIQPNIEETDIKSASEQIEKALSRRIVILDEKNRQTLTEKDISTFIYFEKGRIKSSSVFLPSLERYFPLPEAEDGVNLAYDKGAIRSWAVTLSKNIDRPPVNAKLSGSSGSVSVVTSDRDGRAVLVDNLTDLVKETLDNDSKNEVTLPVKITKAEVRADNLKDLGLKELVSTGWTDFSGSPNNRRVNISVGASKFNGVLIKSGENFSFDDTLGPVEASTGYLPELVIKENKTIPEYGGGLCQVSSTAFRAALNAGLPILERSAHAYPVVYYKPYGVDATIYLPSPDLAFKNDTSGYILIQTHINGNRLYFDFYGTKKPGSIKFAGNKEGTVGVSAAVEGIAPTITEQEARGEGSFTAEFYRFLYDASGKLIKTNNWISRYDSPKKYPH